MISLLEDFKTQRDEGLLSDFKKEQSDGGLLKDFPVKETSPDAPSLKAWNPSLKERIRNKLSDVLKKSPFYEPGKRLGQLGVHYLSEAVSGLGLYVPDVIVSKISEKDTLAEALDTLTGFDPTSREIGAGEAAKFITSLSSVGAAVGPAIAKIPAKAALKTILASGVTFGARKSVEEIAQKISTGDSIDVEGIHFEGGIGVLFGAGEVGVSRFIKFISKFRALPKAQIRPARAEANEALRIMKKTGDRTAWDKIMKKHGFGQAAVAKAKAAPPQPVKDFGKYPLAQRLAGERAAPIVSPAVMRGTKAEKIIHKIQKMTPEEIAEDKAFWEDFDKIKKAVHVPTVEALKDTINDRIGLLEKVKLGIITEAEADTLTKKFADAAKMRIESKAPKEDIISASYYKDKISKIEPLVEQFPDVQEYRDALVHAKRQLMRAEGKLPAVEDENPYLRMPLERVKEDAANGVRLAKDALVELDEITVKPASYKIKNSLIKTAITRGLNTTHLSALSKQITGIDDIDALTEEEAGDLLKALDNYQYMDTWKTQSITKDPEKLLDPSMTKTQMAGILKSAGSIEAYNKAIIYSQKLGGAPSDPSLASIWHRDIINHARYLKRETSRQERERGEASILNPYQSMSYALDKAERRTGIPLRRQWSNMVATSKGWNNKNEEMMWQAIREADVSRLGIVTNREASTKIAQWIGEEDDVFRSNMWDDMKPKTQALALQAEKLLQEYAPLGIRWGRFEVWDRHARIGEEMLNKLHREGKTPTDKQIENAQEKMREKKPPNAPMSALADGRAARESGQLLDWLDTQTWGTRERYYMSEGTHLANDLYEGSLSESIFGGVPEVGELTTAYPSELKTRRGKGAPASSKNVMLDVLRHLDRIYTFASTYEQRMSFWESFRSTNPNEVDLGLMRGADKALRGIMPKTLPAIKVAREVDRLFWRSYLVFDPSGSLWFGWRQILQNIAFDPSQFNMAELMKSIGSFSNVNKSQEWMKNNPDAAETFKEYWDRNVAENRAFYRHFIMKSEYAGGLEMSGILPDYLRKKLRLSEDAVTKVGTFVDMMAFTPGVTDRANRMAVWPVAYDMAQRNLRQFQDGSLSTQGLWNRLALNNITPGESMEMMSLIRDEDYSEFMSRYAEYKTEKIHFRYNPLLRSLQEMTPTGRVLFGLMTFPRGVINIAIKGGLEPIADMMHNPSNANARRAYDGFKTLIKLTAGTGLADMLSIGVVGVGAYSLFQLLFGPTLLSPGASKLYEVAHDNRMIIYQASQNGEPLHVTASKMVANAAGDLEMFIPFAEVAKRSYEVSENRDGVKLFTLAHKLAMEEYFNQHQKPFTYRDRELHEKLQYMFFGKEGKADPKFEWKKSFNIERSKKWD